MPILRRPRLPLLVGAAALLGVALPVVPAMAKPVLAISVTATDNPNPHGRAGYLQAVFSGTQSGIAPTGSVTFTDGGTTLATVPIGFDVIVVPLQGLTVGDHQIVASYSGDGTYPAVQSAAYDEQITASTAKAPKKLPAAIAADLAFARSQWASAESSVPSDQFPQESRAPGSWKFTPSTTWTSGYFPGSILLASAGLGADAIEAAHTAAQPWLDGVAAEDTDTSTQDLGLMMMSAIETDYALTGDSDDVQTLLQGASSLDSRFVPAVGVLPSYHHAADTIGTETDQMPGLTLLFWAAAHGGPASLRTDALSAADIGARDFVRSDGSTWHFANYDPTTGALVSQTQNKGVGDLVWARGQAWAIDGFAADYAATGDAALLAAARSTAAWWISHVPAGGVPYDYFGAPAAPDVPTDTSAAAIASLGLLELAAVDPNHKTAAADRKTADRTLLTLSSPEYLGGTAGLLTDGQGGQVPGDFGSEVIWGDWAFEQALLLADQ